MDNKKTRRKFLRDSFYGSLSLFSFLSCSLNKTKMQPNIFFAIADDWGWPHAGIYGDTVVKTPTFDNIAKNGILFTNAFVSAPSCTPSRNAILTGQYHWRLGPGANLWSSLPEEHKTYPNILEDNGYFVGSYRKSWGPGKSRIRPEAGTKYKSFSEFLKAKPKEKPFCFWFGSSDPHRPYKWQSGINSGMKLENVTVPPCFPDCEEIRTDICDYYWEVQRFDNEVGEALKVLAKSGELENTIVIMTGDHGWPFPRGKTNLYDLGVHVPLAIQWGNRIQKNRTIEDFVSFTDFAPTFMEAIGFDIFPEMTGRSLMNILLSNNSGTIDSSRDFILTGRERHTPAQADHMGGYPMRAIRTKDFLYIHNFKPDRWPAGDVTSIRGPEYSDIDASPTKKYISKHKNDPELKKYFEFACAKRPADELYDLQKDPHQLHNVAKNPEYTSMLQKLENRLMIELKKTADPRVLGRGDVFDRYPYYGNIKKK